MNELYDALNHELESLSLSDARLFLEQLELNVPVPMTDEELIEWVDFLTYCRDKIQKIDNLFLISIN